MIVVVVVMIVVRVVVLVPQAGAALALSLWSSSPTMQPTLLSLVHKTVLLLFAALRAGPRCLALLVQESLANHVGNRAHPGSSPIAVWLLPLDLAEVGRVVVVGAALRAGRRLTGLAARLGAGRRHGAASLPVRCHCLNTCGYEDDDDDGKTTSGSSSGGSSGSGSSSGSSGSSSK